MYRRNVFPALGCFIAYVLIFCSLIYFLVMSSQVKLVLPALLALPLGGVILWAVTQTDLPPLAHLSSAIVALLFMLIVPRGIANYYIDASAMNVSTGGKYCYYQAEGPNPGGILTRNVNDLSFLAMLQRRRRHLDPPHVTLITSKQIWLWSFWMKNFEPWQAIEAGQSTGTPRLEGSQFIGRPPIEQIMRCLQMITGAAP